MNGLITLIDGRMNDELTQWLSGWMDGLIDG